MRLEPEQEDGDEEAGGGGGQELFDGLGDHGVGQTGMMAARAALHLDPHHGGGEKAGAYPASDEESGLGVGMDQEEALCGGGGDADDAGDGDGDGTVAAKRRARRDLGADFPDVGKRFVDVTHGMDP